MNDLDAFDRQIAGEVLQAVRAPRPVDHLAIFSAATQSPKWRFQTMFSATKFVVAAAIVALFGGFLIAGVLTQPDDLSLPAVGASAEAVPTVPTTDTRPADPPLTTTALDLLPGVMLTGEEVESGVFRIVSDGHRDLIGTGEQGERRSHRLVTGADGSVWLLGTRSQNQPDQMTRIGRGEVLPHGPLGPGGSVQIAGDGTVWLHRTKGELGLFSNSGRTWRKRLADRDLMSFKTLPDGSVRVLRRAGPNGQAVEIVRLGRDRASKPSVLTVVPKLEDEVGIPPPDRWWAMSDDGTIWLPGPSGVMKYDGRAWETVGPVMPEAVEQGEKAFARSLEVTPEGQVYVHTGHGGEPVALPLLDDGERSTPPPPLPIRPTEPVHHLAAVTAVAPDGTYWRSVEAVINGEGRGESGLHESWFPGGAPEGMNEAGGCGGLARYDHVVWTRHLEGRCVIEMAFDTHGNTWVRAKTPGLSEKTRTATGVDVHALSFATADIYVITPEAVAATE